MARLRHRTPPHEGDTLSPPRDRHTKMTQAAEALEYLTSAGFLTLGLVAVRAWSRTREPGRLAVAAATTGFGFAGVVIRLNTVTMGRHQVLTDLSIVALLGSALSLFEYRATIMPLKPWLHRGARAVTAIVAGVAVAAVMPPSTAEPFTGIQAILAALVLATFGGLVVEPVGRFVQRARLVAPVEAGRLRLLAAAYSGVVLILVLASALTAARHPGLRVGLQVLAFLLLALLWASLLPPAWLRDRWLTREVARERERMLLGLPALVWTTDAKLRVLASHGAGVNRYTRHPERYRSLPLEEYYRMRGAADDPSTKRSLEMHRRALAGETVTFDDPFEDRIYHTRIEPYRGPDGKIAGVVGLGVDVTERYRAEEVLRDALQREQQAAERLRALDEMKNAFLTAVSHELRTPLTSVLGFAQTLTRDGLADDERMALQHRLVANAQKLDRLLGDLLDLDRLHRGLIEARRRPANLGSLVVRVADAWSMAAGRSVSIDAPSIVVAIDAPKVERIVENLLSNAAKYTPAGTRHWIRVRRTSDGALIAVEDDGPGIPGDLREVVFEPFRQGRELPSHAPGVGIGLSLVGRFAALHGGRAWVEDRPGGGASFRVLLPVVGLDARTGTAEPEQAGDAAIAAVTR